MPIGIFSNIEKLINEHGSATILKERLSLAADQYSALEKKIEQLQSQNQELLLKLDQSESENKTLKGSIRSDEGFGEKLSKDHESVLVFVSKNEGCQDEHVFKALDLNPIKSRHLLDVLRDRKLLYLQMSMNQPSRWKLKKEGREYLVRHDLLD
tara:strand:+ start:395 stop:856 length:462 start_codon:yes stop_codon:yes gene_type:complete